MGSLQAARPFPPGIHVPSLTWFGSDNSQEIDWDLQERHLNFVITSGLHGGQCFCLFHGNTATVADANLIQSSLLGLMVKL